LATQNDPNEKTFQYAHSDQGTFGVIIKPLFYKNLFNFILNYFFVFLYYFAIINDFKKIL